VLIIGEKINTVNSQVRRAIAERDAEFIWDLAIAQVQAGAAIIDINVGSDPSVEPDNMRWAVGVVQEAVDVPLSIDSSFPPTVRAGLQVCNNKEQAWANSICLEKERLEGILPAVAEYECRVIGLCMDERGVPPTAAKRLEAGKRLIDETQRWGVSLDRLYLDALVEPISLKPDSAIVSIETLQSLRTALPSVKTVICLSAISFALPARRLLNRAYLSLLLTTGVNAILLDPLDKQLMATLKATQAVLGLDAGGLEYIAAYRANQLS
jgi:5-methyltetrahydrofolate--homocysteine methyltransferase